MVRDRKQSVAMPSTTQLSRWAINWSCFWSCSIKPEWANNWIQPLFIHLWINQVTNDTTNMIRLLTIGNSREYLSRKRREYICSVCMIAPSLYWLVELELPSVVFQWEEARLETSIYSETCVHRTPMGNHKQSNICRCPIYKGHLPILITVTENEKMTNVQRCSMYQGVQSGRLTVWKNILKSYLEKIFY